MIRPFETRPTKPDKHKISTPCSFCNEKATTDVFFQLEDCLLIQKYCDKCLPNAGYEIPS